MRAAPGHKQPAGPLETGLVAAVAAAVTVAYAMAGGAYDTVVRGQFAIGLWWVIGVSLALGLLPRARAARPWIAVTAGWSLLGALTALAFGWTWSDERTMTELARVLHHAGVLVLVACAVRRETAAAAAGGVAAGAGVVCAVAVGSRLGPGVFPADVAREAFAINRLSYPLDYWNAVGAWGAMTAVLTLALGAHVRAAAPRALAAATVPLGLVTVYLTYSRAGVVGVSVAALAVLALARNRGTALLHLLVAAAGAGAVILAVRAHPAVANGSGGAGGGLVALALLGAAAAAAAVAVVTSRVGADERLRMSSRAARAAVVGGALALAVASATAGPSLASRAWDSFNGQETARADPAARLANLHGTRRIVYASAIESGVERPWRGTGPGTFEFWWSEDARTPEFVRDAHSLYLESFAELGWPGLILSVTVVLALLGAGLAGLRAVGRDGTPAQVGAAVGGVAAAAVFAVQAGLDWMWESTACAALGLGAAGVAACAAQGRRDGPLHPAARAVGALVALAVIAVQLPPLVSLDRVRASQRAAAAGDLQAARVAAADAVESEPWAASPYVQRALLAESTGRLARAEADVRRAVALEPHNWRHPLLLARVLAERGDTAGALRAYRRARSLRPRSDRFAAGG